MIKIETLEVSGFKGAIAGMRNPFKNRELSDSGVYDADRDGNLIFTIGRKDRILCQKLLRAGGDDDSKFMRMIHVQVDISAPLYWWKEFDTYKVSTVANSESTMHTIHKKEFTLDDFSWEMMLDPECQYDCYGIWMTQTEWAQKMVDLLNGTRERYLKAVEKKDPEAKKIWYQIVQLLPNSYMQKRTVDLNYQTLRRIFFARRYHKLDEWREFCAWIKSLPYSDTLIAFEPQKENDIMSFNCMMYAVKDPNSSLYSVDEEHGFDKKAEMQRISQLITDMTIKEAPQEDLVKAVKHSTVIIDAQKLHLDWRQSEKDNDIFYLEKKYGATE